MEPDTIHREEEILASLARQAQAVTTDLFSLSGADAHAVKSQTFMAGPMTFLANNRAGLERLLERIFSAAISCLDIVDRAFTYENFAILKQSRASTPIQLLNYDQPHSGVVREDFAASPTDLRQRSGPVCVRIPFIGPEQACPLAQGSSWIFTDAGAFSLSRSFVAIGSADILVTPFTDDGRLREEHFTQWWEEKAPGAQAQDIR